MEIGRHMTSEQLQAPNQRLEGTPSERVRSSRLSLARRPSAVSLALNRAPMAFQEKSSHGDLFIEG